MNKTTTGIILLALDCAVTFALGARLPAQVPVHWNLHGDADRFGSPWEMVLLGPGVLLIFLVLMVVIEKIDPLASRPLEPDAPESERGAFGVLMLSIMLLGAVAHILMLLSLGGMISISRRIGGLFGPVLLCVIGNFLPRIRPNWFAGIRTPWTISSPKVWRRTHRIAGRVLFFGGLACVPIVLSGSSLVGPVMLAVLIGGLAVPAVASYVWWRQETNGPDRA